MASTPILSLARGDKPLCCLCNETIKDVESAYNLTEEGLQSIQELAARWVKVYKSLCTQAPYAEFQSAAVRLSSAGHDVKIHVNCRITFRNRIARKKNQSHKLPVSSLETIHESNEPVAAPAYRIRRGSLQKKQICFVCNVETKDDSKPYNSGGLGSAPRRMLSVK